MIFAIVYFIGAIGMAAFMIALMKSEGIRLVDAWPNVILAVFGWPVAVGFALGVWWDQK